jgi:FtsZ-binding cell division protein ZapB
VCDTSALWVLDKPEYSKVYKRECSLSSSQQSIQKARDDSKKLNEYLKGKHINYFKIMQSKLQLASKWELLLG